MGAIHVTIPNPADPSWCSLCQLAGSGMRSRIWRLQVSALSGWWCVQYEELEHRERDHGGRDASGADASGCIV